MISIDMGRVHIEVHQGEISNFQNTFDRDCDEIRMEIQKENLFGIGSLISTKFL
jgi:hypothetical protein